MRSKGAVWYIVKVTEFIMVLVCILMLVVNQSIYTVDDDFTPAYPTPKNTSRSIGKGNLTLSPILHSDRQDDPVVLRRVKRASKPKENIKLSHLLIMYPCCTTILLVLCMDFIGQIMRNPLAKGSNIVLLLLCSALSVLLFAVSLFSALSTVLVPMILVAVASAVLVIVIMVDLFLEILS